MKFFILFFIVLLQIFSIFGATNSRNNVPAGFNSMLNKKEIIAKIELNNRRHFFKLFNVHYIICSFAGTGKWPLIPSTMQIQVDTVGRSLFTKNDFFIRNFCKKWFPIEQLYRPTNFQTYVPMAPQPVQMPTTSKSTTANTEYEIFTEELDEAEEPTTICSCGKIKKPQRPSSKITPGVYYFDTTNIGNVSRETILGTIEFLQSFLPSPAPSYSSSVLSSSKRKPKNKTKIRINVQPRFDLTDKN